MSALLVVLSLVLPQTAVSVLSGDITGTLVSKETGKPREGLELLLLRVKKKPGTTEVSLDYFVLDGKFPRATSDASGRFAFRSIPLGKYAITSGASGYDLLLSDERKQPRVFDLNKSKQVLDIGKVLVTAK
jgi:hypothetical protein